jgi:hypothetical protein
MLRSELFRSVTLVLQPVNTKFLKCSSQLKGIHQMADTLQTETKFKKHETHDVFLLLLWM